MPTKNQGPLIYGVGVVQNEGDVIGESVAWAARFCKKLWVWDLGSTDRTWEVLSGLSSERIAVSQRPELTYASSLRSAMVEEVRSQIPEGAWVYILDADEFLVGDPVPLLAQAEAAGAALVKSWFLNFYPTLTDLARLEAEGEEAWARVPVQRRIRCYQLDPWPDKRFVRLTSDVVWSTRGKHNNLRHDDGRRLKVFRRKAVTCHYRYRSPAQVAWRYRTRLASRATGYAGFDYDSGGDFRKYCQRPEACRTWRDDEVAPRLRWKDFAGYQFHRLCHRLGRK